VIITADDPEPVTGPVRLWKADSGSTGSEQPGRSERYDARIQERKRPGAGMVRAGVL